jgi:hypothetical protein
MKSLFKSLLYVIIVATLFSMSGCISCLPQYVAPPEGPVPACYPVGHDPYIPMDHNPSLLNPWDLLASVFAPWLYGPPR